MRHFCSLLLFLFLFLSVTAQHVYKIKTDSLLVTNDSCTAELILENSTKFVNGFLYNKGKGRTEFRRGMIKLTDSTYLFGDDTLNFKSLLSTIGFSGTNIYNFNGTLTGNRSLTLGGYSLSNKIGSNTVEHTFANGNKWFGDGTPADAGHKLDVTGSAIFRSTTWLPTAKFDGSGIQFHRSKFIISDYGDYFDLEPGSSFTFKMNNSTHGYSLKMQENAISFRSTENYAGNYGAPMEFRFTNMNTFQMNPLLPNGYAAGLTVSLHGGTGGDWANVDNRGTPGKLILNGGSAQSNANTLNASAGNVEINGGQGTGNGVGGDILFTTSTALSSGTTLQSLNERLRIKYNTGNVLIGTSTDNGFRLNVNGGIYSTNQGGFFHVGSTDTNDIYLNLQSTNAGMALWRFKSNEDLLTLQLFRGSGTSYQQWPIHFHGPSGNVKIASYPGLGVPTSVTGDITNTRLSVETHYNVQPGIDVFRAQVLNTSNNYGLNAFVVKPSGNVLIGTNTDNTTDRLQINGNAQFFDTNQGSLRIGRHLDGTSSSIGLQYNGNNGYSFYLTNGNGAIPLRATHGGNVVIGATSSIDESLYKLDVNGTTRIQGTLTASSIYSRGYNSYSIDYVNPGNKVFEAGFSSNNTVLYVAHGSISQAWRVAQFITSGGTINFNNGPGATNQEKSALIEMISTDQGFLPPRWSSAQRNTISSPATGLLGYQTDNTENLYINKSTGWKKILTEDDSPAILSGSFAINFNSTNAGTAADITVTLSGAAEGDVVSLGVPNNSVITNTCFTAWVSATDTVTIRFNNYSTNSADPANGTFKIKILK